MTNMSAFLLCTVSQTFSSFSFCVLQRLHDGSFEVGRYYELYGRDVQALAKALRLKVKNDHRGMGMSVGFLKHRCEFYIKKIVHLGFDVGVVRESELPGQYPESVIVQKQCRCKAIKFLIIQLVYQELGNEAGKRRLRMSWFCATRRAIVVRLSFVNDR